MSGPLLVHATAVALDGSAILIRGPSGAGKSDLALRLIDGGARLVADDQSELVRRGERIIVRAPPALAGLIEIRGLGIIRLEALPEAPLGLIADISAPAAIERLPARTAAEEVLGIAVPLVAVAPFEASAAAKLRIAHRALAPPPRLAMIDT
jgi:HPr kinase/phosphorylase